MPAAPLAAAEGRMPGRRFAVLVALAAIVEAALVYLTPPSLFRGVDYVFLHSFNRQYLTSALAAGRLPLWNPHVGLGRPFLADIEVAGFYPPTLLHLLFGLRGGIGVLAVLHHVLGVAAMTGLARAIGCGRAASAAVALVFMAGAPVVGHVQAGQLPYGFAIAYLPLCLLVARRLQDRPSLARVAQLAAVLALQFLCGHPQIAWITWVAAGTFLLGRRLEPPWPLSLRLAARDLGGLLLALAWAAAVAAVQLLPFWELVRQGNRVRPSAAFAAAGAMDAASWLSLLAPMSDLRKFGWETNLYAGVAVVIAGACGLAAIGGREARALALMAAAGVLVAAGPALPLFPMVRAVLPGLSSFHLHSRAAILLPLSLALGTGLLLSNRPRGRAWIALAAVVAAAAAAAAWAAPSPGAAVLGVFRLALPAAAAALLVAWQASSRWVRVAAATALAAATLLDLGLATARLKWEYAGPVDFPNERLVARAIRQLGLEDPRGIPPRVSVPMSLARPDAGMTHGYSTYMGYVALSLDRVWSYLHVVRGLPPSEAENTYPSPQIPLAAPFPYDTMNLSLGYDARTGNLVARRNPDPRAYVVHAAASVPGWHEALARLAAGQDVRTAALVEGAPPLAPPAPHAAPTATIRSYAPERMVVDVQAAAPGYLILSEPWYPGWRARVNGAPAPCVAANVWMRAVPVAAGRSEVVVDFPATRLLPGALVSAAAVLGIGAALARARGDAGSGPDPAGAD